MPMIPANQQAARDYDQKVRQQRIDRGNADGACETERATARRIRPTAQHREARKRDKPSPKMRAPAKVRVPKPPAAEHVRWPGREPGGVIPVEESRRRSASQREAQNRPDVKACTSASALASWADPDVRRRRIAAMVAAIAKRKAGKA